MDLYLDQDAFERGKNDLKTKCEELRALRRDISASFDQLRQDWDSEAGREFFARFENDLLANLEKHSTVFEYMSTNLSTASYKYDEVFRAADSVANAQF
jgi:uncharacterized protein YukE